MCVNRFLSCPRLRAQIISGTECRLPVFTIPCCGVSFLYAGTMPPSVGKTSTCSRHPPLATLYLHWRVKIQVASYSWMRAGAYVAGWETHWFLWAGNRWYCPSICHNMDWIPLWWLRWAACDGWLHEPSVHTCAATKSLTLGKGHISEQPCPGPKYCLVPHSLSH